MTDPMDIEALRRLADDRQFAKLNEHVGALALVRALGTERDELAHSCLLAFLLDPQRRRGALTMLSALLSEIVDRLPPERDVDDRLRMIAESP